MTLVAMTRIKGRTRLTTFTSFSVDALAQNRAYLFMYTPEQAVYSRCAGRFHEITFQARYKFR